MSDDPQPIFRCRCCAWDANGGWLDSYNHRCPQRPTQEDGLCDHCRQTGPCSDPECVDMDGSRGWGCCLQSYAARAFVDLMTPCYAVAPKEVPF